MPADAAMPDPSPSPTSVGRIVAIVTGALLSLLALALVIGAVAMLVVMAVSRDDGFLTSPKANLQTDTRAIVSEPLELQSVDDWSPGSDRVHMRVTVSEASEPLFLGIARAAEVDAALQGVSHAVVTGATAADWGTGFGDIDYDIRDGGAAPSAPAGLVDWEAQASGAGDLALDWTPRDGDWVVVLMDANGSPGIDADVRVGVDVPWLGTIAWGLLALGVAIGAVAALLLLAGVGRRRDARSVLPMSQRGDAPSPAQAVRVTASMSDPPGRWLWLVKWLLLIPHYVVLVVLYAAFAVCTVIAWFAIVVTGRYPRALFDFNVGVLRWSWRVNGYAYGALATDRYPPFSLADDPGYPVRLEIDYPERLSRALPLVKWLLAFPHLLLLGAATGGVVIGTATQESPAQVGVIGVLVLVTAIGLLFTGRLPSGAFDLLVGVQRWLYRTVAYVALLTDEYPPFRLDQGGDEPVYVSLDEPRPSPSAAATPPGPVEASP